VKKFLRKTFKWLTILLVVAIAVVLVAIPLVLPGIVEGKLETLAAEQQFPVKVRLNLGYCWRNGPGLAGKLSVMSLEAPWRISAEFGASCCEWAVSLRMGETKFSEQDRVLQKLHKRFPMAGVTNLTFSGSAAFEANVVRTFSKPVPVWSVKVPLSDLAVSYAAAEKTVSAEGFSVTPSSSGIAEHYDIAPMFIRGKSLTFNGFKMTDVRAAIQASEKHLLMTEASADFCGGKASVYALYLDMKSLNTGFTLFLDNVEAGEALSHVRDFRGRASGRLHGKVKLFAREGGKSLRFSDAFLYSTPGEIGKLQLPNAERMAETLEMAGIAASERQNIANVMADVDYSVLKLNLKRGEGKTATLSTRVVGTATRGQVTVPVDVTINLRGEIEQLLNLGLGYSNQMKGKK